MFAAHTSELPSESEEHRPGPGLDGERLRRRPGQVIGLEALRELVAGSDEGMVLADEDARITYANPAAARILGIPLHEVVGRKGADIPRPEHLFTARQAFQRALASPGVPIELQIDALQAGGAYRTLEVRAVNHLQTPGIEAVVGHFRAAGPATTAGELGKSYRALFQNALVGMGVADMQGNLLAFNDAMLEPGGYTREEILDIGNVARLYADEADRGRVLRILRAQGHVWREEVPFRRRDGTTYDTLLTLTPVVFLGRPCLYATVEVIDRAHR